MAGRPTRCMLVSRWIIETHWPPWICCPLVRLGKVNQQWHLFKSLPAPGSHLFSSWEAEDHLLLLMLRQQVHFSMGWSNGQPPLSARACLSLSTCSTTVNFENCHSPSGWWKFHHWCPLGWSFWRRGPKSCRVPHTFSRSSALWPCLMAVGDHPDGQPGTRHWQLWRAFCSWYALWDGRGSRGVIKKLQWEPVNTHQQLPLLDFCQSEDLHNEDHWEGSI